MARARRRSGRRPRRRTKRGKRKYKSRRRRSKRPARSAYKLARAALRSTISIKRKLRNDLQVRDFSAFSSDGINAGLWVSGNEPYANQFVTAGALVTGRGYAYTDMFLSQPIYNEAMQEAYFEGTSYSAAAPGLRPSPARIGSTITVKSLRYDMTFTMCPDAFAMLSEANPFPNETPAKAAISQYQARAATMTIQTVRTDPNTAAPHPPLLAFYNPECYQDFAIHQNHTIIPVPIPGEPRYATQTQRGKTPTTIRLMLIRVDGDPLTQQKGCELLEPIPGEVGKYSIANIQGYPTVASTNVSQVPWQGTRNNLQNTRWMNTILETPAAQETSDGQGDYAGVNSWFATRKFISQQAQPAINAPTETTEQFNMRGSGAKKVKYKIIIDRRITLRTPLINAPRGNSSAALMPGSQTAAGNITSGIAVINDPIPPVITGSEPWQVTQISDSQEIPRATYRLRGNIPISKHGLNLNYLPSKVSEDEPQHMAEFGQWTRPTNVNYYWYCVTDDLTKFVTWNARFRMKFYP